MIDFYEVIWRSEHGEKISEDEFNRRVGRISAEVIRKYKIKYDPEVVIPWDDNLMDRLFDAAVEFFLKVGVYCTDTGRVMIFNKQELFDSLESATAQIVWGQGRDQRVQKARKVEDPKPPFCNFTLVGNPYSEETFLQAAMSVAKEPLADCFSGGSLLHTLGGLEVRSGSPMEVEAGIWDIGKRREAAIRAGYPGKGLYTMVSAAESADAMIAAAYPGFGSLPNDGVLHGAIAEMKVDYDRMKKIPFFIKTQYTIGGLYGPLMGGYAGGPEGTSMVLVAHHFLGRLVFQTQYSCCFPIEIHETCNTTRRMLWLVSTAHQALSRNTHLLRFSNAFIAAGPCTDVACYELINFGVASAVSGADLSPSAVARNKNAERCTGMEGRICAEAAHAASRMGMSRKEANDFVKKILTKYEDRIPEAPIGKTISECYDMDRVVPTQEYLDLYEKIKNEASDCGLKYPSFERGE